MGAGKSEVGRRVALRLGRLFVDSDAEVEREAGARVAEIFAREGEAGFRARERRAVAEAGRRAAVVSLGGGAMAQPGAADQLVGSGTVVYLRARPETLAARIGADPERPLIAGLDAAGRLARIRELLAEREIHYLRAQIVIDTDDMGVEAVAQTVVETVAAERPGATEKDGPTR